VNISPGFGVGGNWPQRGVLLQNLLGDQFLGLLKIHAAHDGLLFDDIRADEPVINLGAFEKLTRKKPSVAADDARRCHAMVIG